MSEHDSGPNVGAIVGGTIAAVVVIVGVSIAILHGKHKEGKLKCPQNPFPNVQNRLRNVGTRLRNVRNPFRNVRNPFRNVRNSFRNLRNPFRNVRRNRTHQTNNVTSDTVAFNNDANITLATIDTSHNGQSTEEETNTTTVLSRVAQSENETTSGQKPPPPFNSMSNPPPYTPGLYPSVPTMAQYHDPYETDKEKQGTGFRTEEPPPYDESWAAYPPPL